METVDSEQFYLELSNSYDNEASIYLAQQQIKQTEEDLQKDQEEQEKEIQYNKNNNGLKIVQDIMQKLGPNDQIIKMKVDEKKQSILFGMRLYKNLRSKLFKSNTKMGQRGSGLKIKIPRLEFKSDNQGQNQQKEVKEPPRPKHVKPSQHQKGTLSIQIQDNPDIPQSQSNIDIPEENFDTSNWIQFVSTQRYEGGISSRDDDRCLGGITSRTDDRGFIGSMTDRQILGSCERINLQLGNDKQLKNIEKFI